MKGRKNHVDLLFLLYLYSVGALFFHVNHVLFLIVACCFSPDCF
jgi:hypothetical protein